MNADSADSAPIDAEATEAARKLFAGPCDFVAGSTHVGSLPEPTLIEVAFAGRSNVGKSSLVNALTGRKTLARTSQTPGRTQQINFFDLGHRLMLVDLPGYGYSRAGKGKARAWNRLIDLYLKGRARLRRVLILVDVRRGIGPGDREAMDKLDAAAVSYQIVLTKADKAGGKAAEVAQAAAEAIRTRPAAHPDIIITSSRDGIGIEELRTLLAALAPPEQLG